MQNFSNLTYAIKSIDRPKVNLKTEELNEYNKKRIIHTGFKLEPIKFQLYDSADGSAQHMFAAYCQYYFGDLMNQGSGINTTNFSYSYDATMSLFRDFSGGGFGFTAGNGKLGGINTGIELRKCFHCSRNNLNKDRSYSKLASCFFNFRIKFFS